jgi:hypothetical protein
MGILIFENSFVVLKIFDFRFWALAPTVVICRQSSAPKLLFLGSHELQEPRIPFLIIHIGTLHRHVEDSYQKIHFAIVMSMTPIIPTVFPSQCKLERNSDLAPTDDIYRSAPVPPGSRSIRVLDLEAHSKSGKLCGTLRVVRLSENPKFTTISYVWGSGTSEISVNGHGLAITENCYNALTALRTQYGALTIWVDSICINQQDEAEKSDQIPLIEEIYAWAETVYIWFGNGSDHSYAAMECLLMVPKKFQCLWLTRWAADPSIKARVTGALYTFLRVLGYYFRYIPLGRSGTLSHLVLYNKC